MNSLFSDLLIQADALTKDMRKFLEGSSWLNSSERTVDQRLEVFNLIVFLTDSLTAVKSWGAAQEAVLQGLLMPEEAFGESALLAETEDRLAALILDSKKYPEELISLLDRFNDLFFGLEQLDSLLWNKAA